MGDSDATVASSLYDGHSVLQRFVDNEAHNLNGQAIAAKIFIDSLTSKSIQEAEDVAKRAAQLFEAAEKYMNLHPARANRIRSAFNHDLASHHWENFPQYCKAVQPLSEKIEKALARKCNCDCRLGCSCECSCKCCCTCSIKCELKCKPRQGSRNLVVSIDGTSNQFGKHNTNVVELHRRIIKDSHTVTQLTYYNSGIGTFAPHTNRSPSYWAQKFSNTIDLAIAWNFEKIVQSAYRWLADHYEAGDKVFLFGFSRGAYQVRTLAGMIEKVGLVFPGNQEQIPFAYELYAGRYKGKKQDTKDMSLRFKETFSRNISVHFLGVWDTVSSVGIFRKETLPFTDSSACVFRHALALDERRVKFLPEFSHGGNSHFDHAKDTNLTNDEGNADAHHQLPTAPFVEERLSTASSAPPGISEVVPKAIGDYFKTSKVKKNQVETEHSDPVTPEVACKESWDSKEVWFAGCHSDIGGGNKENTELNLAGVALTWMENEAMIAGLELESRPFEDLWKVKELQDDKLTKSLGGGWWFLEFLPIKRLSYRGPVETSRMPHIGKGRKIVFGQKIHASVAFRKRSCYTPHAQAKSPQEKIIWDSLVGSGNTEDISWTQPWEEYLEMDLFNHSFVRPILEQLHENKSASLEELKRWLHRLRFMALSADGARNIAAFEIDSDDGKPDKSKLTGVKVIAEILKNESLGIEVSQISANCLCQLAKYTDIKAAIDETGGLGRLQSMLSADESVQDSSIDCLSRCVVNPEKTNRRTPSRQPTVSDKAKEIIIREKASNVLLRMLKDKDNKVRCRGASCLFRLAQDDAIRTEILGNKIVPELVKNLEQESSKVQEASEVREKSKVLEKCLRTLCELARHDGGRTVIHEANAIPRIVKHLETDSPMIKHYRTACISQLAKDVCIRPTILESIDFSKLLGMIQSNDSGARESGVVGFSEIAKYEDFRRIMIEQKVIPNLADLLNVKYSASVRFWSAVCIYRLAEHSDLCNEMLKEKLMRILIRMVGHDCIGVAAACSLALAEFAKHENSRQKMIEKENFRSFTGMLLSKERPITAREALQHCQAPVNSKHPLPVNGQIGRRTCGMIPLVELAKFGDIISAIEQDTVDAGIKLLKTGLGAPQIYSMKFFCNLATHDPSVPQADELVKEISGLLESDNHAVRASSVETLVGFTKYDAWRKTVTQSLFRFPNKSKRGVWIGYGKVFAELAKYEDTRNTIFEIEMIRSLVGGLEVTDGDKIDDEGNDEDTGATSTDPARHNRHEQLITDANIFAELVKHDHTREAILSEPTVEAFVGILKCPWPRVREATVDALVELAKHDGAKDRFLEVQSQIKELYAAPEHRQVQTGPLWRLQESIMKWMDVE